MASKLTKELAQRILKARETRDMVENSLFIRIGTSTLYDYNVGLRATLREIAFMAVKDEDGKKPEGSHFKEYTGWSWAGQEYLGERVGKSERQVRRDVDRFVADGVIKTREWPDQWGHPHLEYFVIPEVVDAPQRTEGDKRKRPTSRVYKANNGSFKARAGRSMVAPVPLAMQPPVESMNMRVTSNLTPVEANPPDISAANHRTSHPETPDISATSHRTSQTSPTAEIAAKGVDLVRALVREVGGTVSSTPSSRVADELRSLPSEGKARATPQGFGLVSKTTAKPTPTPKLQTFDYLEEDVDICTECAVAKGHAKTCSKYKAKGKAAGFDLTEI